MKKIFSIIVLSLVGLLVAATVVLALVSTSQYNPVVNDADYIVVYKNSQTNSNPYAKDSEEYKKIYDLHKQSLKQNILSTMFQGALGNNSELTKVSEANISSLLNAENSGLFVEFAFDNEDQVLMWEDKQYTYETSNGAKKVATFDALYLGIENTENYTTITVYVVLNGKYNFKITSLAHQSELYEYVNALSWAGSVN